MARNRAATTEATEVVTDDGDTKAPRRTRTRKPEAERTSATIQLTDAEKATVMRRRDEVQADFGLPIGFTDACAMVFKRAVAGLAAEYARKDSEQP
jgi:hypothetical protein